MRLFRILVFFHSFSSLFPVKSVPGVYFTMLRYVAKKTEVTWSIHRRDDDVNQPFWKTGFIFYGRRREYLHVPRKKKKKREKKPFPLFHYQKQTSHSAERSTRSLFHVVADVRREKSKRKENSATTVVLRESQETGKSNNQRRTLCSGSIGRKKNW